MENNSAWGQLVSLTEFDSPPIPLQQAIFQIGRALDCDLSFPENKLISGHHCHIERDAKTATTFLIDTSTNGTLLNLECKISKGMKKELKHGDEFYVVYKTDNKELNVGYIYQDNEELKLEESTQSNTPLELLDSTLEDSDCNYVSPKQSKKCKSSHSNEGGSEDSAPFKKPKVENEKKGEGEETKNNRREELREKNMQVSKNNESEKESAIANLVSSSVTMPASVPSSVLSTATATNEKTSSTKTFTAQARDDIEENLQCMICQEIMHNCISLQPCLHSFCAGCYSDWMARSQECPSCRKNVERINKNHILNNLIEAYLKEHPEKKRPVDDIEELNKKNKITVDMLYPKEIKSIDSSSDYSNTDDDDDDDDASGLVRTTGLSTVSAAPVLYGFGTPVFGINRAFKTVCRQCPGYVDPNANKATEGAKGSDVSNTGIIYNIGTALTTVNNIITGAGDQPMQGNSASLSDSTGPSSAAMKTEVPFETSSGQSKDEPSTSGTDVKPYKDDGKQIPTPPNHICPINQNHVLCQCCLQPMPDFRLHWPFPTLEVVPQQCGMCYRAFCHAYWGCRKQDCLGCINKFRDMNFGRKALNGLILENQVESEIFKEYMDNHGMSVKDILQECCRQMDAGKFAVPAQDTHHFTSNMPVCYACGLNQFKQLAFQYRKTWKNEDLPDSARNRADCYWGYRCRTQRNKPHHAKNFNHICEQTRRF